MLFFRGKSANKVALKRIPAIKKLPDWPQEQTNRQHIHRQEKSRTSAATLTLNPT
ncbi:hypothetical protein D3C87_1199060 [compost metagenome]